MLLNSRAGRYLMNQGKGLSNINQICSNGCESEYHSLMPEYLDPEVTND